MTKLILGIAIGALIVWVIVRAKAGKIVNPQQIEERQKNLEKVLALARARGQIANDDVQNELKVSDATATRYLEELERQGQLVQIGTKKGAIYRIK